MDVVLVGFIAGLTFGGWRTGFLHRLAGLGVRPRMDAQHVGIVGPLRAFRLRGVLQAGHARQARSVTHLSSLWLSHAASA